MRLPCFFVILFAITSLTQADDWPEYRGPDRAGLWNAEGLVDSFEGKQPAQVWSSPVGAGYSGPTVAGDGVYVMDRGAPGSSSEVERIVCVDRATGKQRWAHEYECVYRDVGYAYGPRASVTVRDGKAWALGTMGHLHCLDAETGAVIWSHDLGSQFDIDMPIWGLTCSPLVEADVVVVQIGAKQDAACMVGFHKDTGKEVWRAFDDKASYVSPIMLEQAGQRVLVAWTGFRIAGMDAATGKVLWEIPTKPNKMPINVPGPAVSEDGKHLFLSVFYDGSRLIELDQEKMAAKELWHRQGTSERKTDALHSMISPPYIFKNHVYGIDSYGQMRCLELMTGDRVWENLEAVTQGRWGTAFMVRNTVDNRTWMLNERGEVVVANLTPQGYDEIDRVKIIEPTTELKQRPEGTVLWSHPAFAGTQIFARNDRELICVELGK
jgi:outer membrane protein assembly factor BamB